MKNDEKIRVSRIQSTKCFSFRVNSFNKELNHIISLTDILVTKHKIINIITNTFNENL